MSCTARYVARSCGCVDAVEFNFYTVEISHYSVVFSLPHVQLPAQFRHSVIVSINLISISYSVAQKPDEQFSKWKVVTGAVQMVRLKLVGLCN